MWGSREESCHHPPLCHVHFRHHLGLQWLRGASGAWAICSVGSPTGSPFEDRNPLGESGLNVRGSAAGTVISFAVAISLSETQGFCPIIYSLVLIISRSLLTWILGFAWSEQVPEVALNSAFVFRHFYKGPSFRCDIFFCGKDTILLYNELEVLSPILWGLGPGFFECGLTVQLGNWHPGVKSAIPLMMQDLMIGHLPSFKIGMRISTSCF